MAAALIWSSESLDDIEPLPSLSLVTRRTTRNAWSKRCSILAM